MPSAEQPSLSIVAFVVRREALREAAGSMAGAALVSASLDASIRAWQRGQPGGRSLLRGHGGEVKCRSQTCGTTPASQLTPCKRVAYKLMYTMTTNTAQRHILTARPKSSGSLLVLRRWREGHAAVDDLKWVLRVLSPAAAGETCVLRRELIRGSRRGTFCSAPAYEATTKLDSAVFCPAAVDDGPVPVPGLTDAATLCRLDLRASRSVVQSLKPGVREKVSTLWLLPPLRSLACPVVRPLFPV